MIKYKLTEPENPLRNPLNPRTVEVNLPAATLHERARWEITGHDLLAHEVAERLFGCIGFRGRMIHEETTPIDLSVAMSVHFRKYAPELIEGEEILQEPV